MLEVHNILFGVKKMLEASNNFTAKNRRLFAQCIRKQSISFNHC